MDGRSATTDVPSLNSVAVISVIDMMPIGPEAMAAATTAGAAASVPVAGSATFLDGLMAALESSVGRHPAGRAAAGAVAEAVDLPVATEPVEADAPVAAEPVVNADASIADATAPSTPCLTLPHPDQPRVTAPRLAPNPISIDPAIADEPKDASPMTVNVDERGDTPDTAPEATSVALPPPVVSQLPPPTISGAPAVAPTELVAVPADSTPAPPAVTETVVADAADVSVEAPKTSRLGRRNQERAGRTAEMPVVKTPRLLGRNRSAIRPTNDYPPHELRETLAALDVAPRRGPAAAVPTTMSSSLPTPLASPLPAPAPLPAPSSAPISAQTASALSAPSLLPPPSPVVERRASAVSTVEPSGPALPAAANAALPAPVDAARAAQLPSHALTAPPSAVPAAPARAALPSNLGMVSVDRVRFAREQAPSRAVQRLAIDLDGAQVAVRVHHDRVAVEVVDDPSGTLGAAWAKQVERTLDQAVRSVSEPQRNDGLPQPQRAQSSGHDSAAGDGGGRRQQSPSDSGEQGQQRRWQRAFSMFGEEED